MGNMQDERHRSALHIAAVCNPSDAEIAARWAILELLLKPPQGLSARLRNSKAVGPSPATHVFHTAMQAGKAWYQIAAQCLENRIFLHSDIKHKSLHNHCVFFSRPW